MSPDRFSRQLLLGFEAVRATAEDALKRAGPTEPALLGLSLDDLVRLARDSSIPVSDQGALWAAFLRFYRRGRADSLGPVLLEMLAPALVSLSKRFSTVDPVASSLDVKRQLVLEIKRRVRRWLAREVARRAESLEALSGDDRDESKALVDESRAHQAEAVWELAELRNSPACRNDLKLLWRLQVRGETLADVAREIGCTPKALDCRRRRARARLRRQIAA